MSHKLQVPLFVQFKQILAEYKINISHGFINDVFPELTFPYNNYMPACIVQIVVVALVAFFVAANLGNPEIRVTFGCGIFAASFMPVSEASVHEYGGSVPS